MIGVNHLREQGLLLEHLSQRMGRRTRPVQFHDAIRWDKADLGLESIRSSSFRHIRARLHRQFWYPVNSSDLTYQTPLHREG